MKETTANSNLESFNYILNDYNVLWAYYNKLLDERQTLFDNYIKVIGIPLTLITAFLSAKGTNAIDPSITKYMIALILSICFIGHSFAYIFMRETINSIKYLHVLNTIQHFIRDKYINAQFKDIVFVLQEGDFNNKADSTKLCKIGIIVSINAMVTTTLFILLKSLFIFNDIYVIFSCIFDFVFQMFFFFVLQKILTK